MNKVWLKMAPQIYSHPDIILCMWWCHSVRCSLKQNHINWYWLLNDRMISEPPLRWALRSAGGHYRWRSTGRVRTLCQLKETSWMWMRDFTWEDCRIRSPPAGSMYDFTLYTPVTLHTFPQELCRHRWTRSTCEALTSCTVDINVNHHLTWV